MIKLHDKIRINNSAIQAGFVLLLPNQLSYFNLAFLRAYSINILVGTIVSIRPILNALLAPRAIPARSILSDRKLIYILTFQTLSTCFCLHVLIITDGQDSIQLNRINPIITRKSINYNSQTFPLHANISCRTVLSCVSYI